MPRLRSRSIALLLVVLSACASPPATEPGVIEAPRLHAQWWRGEFYGYDEAAYRLRHTAAGDELVVDLRYGAASADFRAIDWPGLGIQPLRVLEHSAERCQVFGSLQSRCIYHDVLDLDPPPGALERARAEGVELALLGKAGGRQGLALPGGYIGEFLRARTAKIIPAKP